MNSLALSYIKRSNQDLYVKVGDFKSKVLVNEDEIRSAQGLLYETYVNQGWRWSEDNNPTGINLVFSIYCSFHEECINVIRNPHTDDFIVARFPRS